MTTRSFLDELSLRLISCPDSACGAIAEIFDSVVLGSTDGPIEMVRTRCLHRHVFVLPFGWPGPSSPSHA